MRKKAQGAKAVLVLSLLILLLLPAFTTAAPPVCGDGSCHPSESCSSCSADCGACPPPPPSGGGGTTTTTVTTEGGGGPKPVKIVVKNPQDGDTIKRGVLTILVEGYVASNLDSEVRVSAESELFGEIKLINNFEQRGTGIYGANVTIGKDIEKGEHAIVVKGELATYDEQRILINVDPEIYINVFFNQEEFLKGERILLSGNLAYFDGEPVKNNTLVLSISAPDFLINKTIWSDILGRFDDSYLISFAEPDGQWSINILAADRDANEGKANFVKKVSTPAGVAFYTVTFLSPLKNAEFKRGSTVPITVEIKDEGKPVEKANLDFRNPKAEITALREITPGTYTAEYKVSWDDPVGNWYIAVQAVKATNNITKAGGTKIPVMIRPAAPNLVLVRPATADFFTGLKTEIKAELNYPDGTKIEKADVFAVIGDQIIKLTETDSGEYSAFYLFTEKDVEAASLQLSASDIYGNSIALTPKAIEVKQIGKYELILRLFYYNILARYWYLFVLGVFLVALATRPLWYGAYLKRSLEKAVENEKRVVVMEKDTQRKYFKQHSIPREDYDKLMMKYRERASDLKEKKLRLGSALAGKNRKIEISQNFRSNLKSAVSGSFLSDWKLRSKKKKR